ncbi:MAG: hypothetical protein QGH44_07680 [Arenicellales bacterium]|jgi:hypothetical protein|nr:hypothetical protein [Arenicellales bacterium]|tara:strand:- start:686 stop:931 length:246 start_codon:yes stop_codon:yes gene_type:complete
MNAQYNEMTMDEMDQVNGGNYAPGYEGPDQGPNTVWGYVLFVVAVAVVAAAVSADDKLDDLNEGTKKQLKNDRNKKQRAKN